MSNVTERIRKFEEQVTKDSLRIKKLERQVERSQGLVLLVLKAIMISAITAVFLAVSELSLTDNFVAALVPGAGYIVLELLVRLYNMRYGRR